MTTPLGRAAVSRLDLAAEDYVGTQYLRVATVLAPSRGEIDCADSTTIMSVGPIDSPDTPGIIVLTYDLGFAMGNSAEEAKLGYFRVATIEWPGGESVTSTATPTPSGS